MHALLQEIRQHFDSMSLPVIVLYHQQGKQRLEIFQWGANEVIETPVDVPLALFRIQAQIKRRQSVEALKETRERFTLAVAGSKDGIWDWNLKTGKVNFSPRWAGILGYKPEGIGNDPEAWFGRIHPLDQDRVKGELDAHLSGQTPFWESEHRLLHSDGFYRWVYAQGLAAREKDGNPTRVAGSLSDFTHNKMADALTGLPNRSFSWTAWDVHWCEPSATAIICLPSSFSISIGLKRSMMEWGTRLEINF